MRPPLPNRASVLLLLVQLLVPRHLATATLLLPRLRLSHSRLLDGAAVKQLRPDDMLRNKLLRLFPSKS